MKKNILQILVFVILVLNTTCAPDTNLDTSPSSNIGETVAINIKEYKTNLPVSGAKFSTYYCKEHDVEFGNCINQILLSSCTTDDKYVLKINNTFCSKTIQDIIYV